MASAPGVAFLLGEHTEFCSGMAIGFGLPLRSWVAVSLRNDSSLRFYSPGPGERKRSSTSNLKYKREDRWANHLKGVLLGLSNAGCPIQGLNISFLGTIPQNKGLFSSGALCLSLARAVSDAMGFDISDQQLIQAVVFAQKNFSSNYVSPLEIYTSLYAKNHELLVLDQRNFSRTYVPYEFNGTQMLLIDTQVPQSDFEEDLEERIEVCQEATRVIKERIPGGDLRSVTTRDFRVSLGAVSESVRRVSIHGSNEHARFVELSHMIGEQNLTLAGKILNRSQEDLRDLFEVSCPEVDWISKHTIELPGVYCTRLTGVGIASCAITIYDSKVHQELITRLEEYERIFGFHPELHTIYPSMGLIVHRSPGG